MHETIKSRNTVYTGPIFRVDKMEVVLPDGRPAMRDVVVNPDASAIVPLLSDGRVVMVRQFRVTANRVMLEIPAGKLDPHEEPLAAAHRELAEETGYRASSMRYLFGTRVSPGFSTEIIHIFLATGLYLGETHFDEDEFVELALYPLSELVQMVMRGEIDDGKSVAGILAAAQLQD